MVATLPRAAAARPLHSRSAMPAANASRHRTSLRSSPISFVSAPRCARSASNRASSLRRDKRSSPCLTAFLSSARSRALYAPTLHLSECSFCCSAARASAAASACTRSSRCRSSASVAAASSSRAAAASASAA
eukprot:1226715-Pleurochrysis_carterae.AAC.1